MKYQPIQPEPTIIERIKTRPPKLFRTLAKIGLVLGAVSGAILASPVALPATVVMVAGYMALGAGITTALSTLPNEGE